MQEIIFWGLQYQWLFYSLWLSEGGLRHQRQYHMPPLTLDIIFLVYILRGLKYIRPFLLQILFYKYEFCDMGMGTTYIIIATPWEILEIVILRGL